MKNASIFLIIAAVLAPTGFTSAIAQTQSPLSLASYVDLAEKNNPQVRVANAAVASGVAAWKSARSKLLPQVSGQANAGSSMSPGVVRSSGENFGNSYTAGVTGQQLLFDFGKSYLSTRAGSKLVAAAREDAKSSLQTVVLNAKTAYFNHLLSQMLYAVASEALSQTKAHLDQARILYETGKQAKYTVTAAEVDVANATVNVITTRNGVKLAKVQMEVAAGISLGDSLLLTDSLFVKEPDITREQALARATDSLPQLVSLRARLEAAKLQLTSAKAALLPNLNATAGIGYESQSTYASEWQQDWNVGVNLAVPIFQGGFLVAAMEATQASVDQSKATLDATVQSVQSAIDQDYYGKVEAAERITAMQKLIQSSQESLELAQERFAAGAAASLEVTDAELVLANAKSSYAQALYDYRTGHAKLLAAMGSF
ncbi:MAG TPA: TolC family protein [Chitinivibrionales bacterium]|jgi:TolC family type I secretion outer membrane protein|nr:TolC family protein [Chitinivibrionales bacterium]